MGPAGAAASTNRPHKRKYTRLTGEVGRVALQVGADDSDGRRDVERGWVHGARVCVGSLSRRAGLYKKDAEV